VTILDRNSGTSTTTGLTTWPVTRSSGSFGTGTTLVVMFVGNVTFSTPSGWTLRASSVSSQGLYIFDKVAAGETTINFTSGVAGGCQWYAWELSAGAAWLGGQAQELAAAATVPLPSITPSAGNRHMLGVAGANAIGNPQSVTAFDNGYTRWGGAQTQTGDWILSAAADRDVAANGSTAYTSTATLSANIGPRAALHAAYTDTATVDTSPPSIPTGLTAVNVGATTADLSWVAATDDVGVTGYQVQIVGP